MESGADRDEVLPKEVGASVFAFEIRARLFGWRLARRLRDIPGVLTYVRESGGWDLLLAVPVRSMLSLTRAAAGERQVVRLEIVWSNCLPCGASWR
jgi:hypothetical protein